MDLSKLTPTEVLTAALVVVTIYYAWQTRQTVAELRRARGAAVFPRLRATIYSTGAGNGFVHVENVGTGPAIDIEATIAFEPGGPSIPWRSQLLVAGQRRELRMRSVKSPEGTFRIDEVVAEHQFLHLVATYRDALGEGHSIDEKVDIREWWRVVIEARQVVDKDWPLEQYRELERIRKELESASRSIAKIADRDDPRPWRWEFRIRRLPVRWQPAARRLADRLGLLDF